MSWVATHLDWLIGAAWAVVEIWRGKGRGKAKALETAKELAHRAKELDLERQRAALERGSLKPVISGTYKRGLGVLVSGLPSKPTKRLEVVEML